MTNACTRTHTIFSKRTRPESGVGGGGGGGGGGGEIKTLHSNLAPQRGGRIIEQVR